MSAMIGQLGLFETERDDDRAHVALARERMSEMIERLRRSSVPPWKDEMAVILDDGSFRRAMRLVPEPEAQALWAIFNAQVERLYAIFEAAQA